MSNAETQTVKTPERNQENTVDLTRVFGPSWESLPGTIKDRVRAGMANPDSDPKLYKLLQEGSAKDIGKVAGDVPANFEQGSADNSVKNWQVRAMTALAIPAAAIARFWGKKTGNDLLVTKSQRKRNPGESQAEYYARMKSHAKTTAAMGALAILGAASGGAAAFGAPAAAVYGLKGAAFAGSIANGLWQAKRKDGLANPLAGYAGGAAMLATGAGTHYGPGVIDSLTKDSPEVRLTSTQLDYNVEGSPEAQFEDNVRARDISDYPHLNQEQAGADEHTSWFAQGESQYRYNSHNDNLPFDANNDDAPAGTGETAVELAAASRAQELTFLEENGRHNNDFNSITPEELNDPANEGHFPGYTALMEQYNESPQELAAQLYQIYEIESANGHSFDALPPELRELAGGNSHEFMTALAEAMHADPELHDLLTSATLDYIQEHGSPLTDLTGSYEANYIVIEDGKPVVKLDDYVESASTEDTVIMLSETKGIRFPCGQPIEIILQPEYVAPVASYQPMYEQPTYTPPVETTPPPEVIPPTVTPPETEPPVVIPPNPEPPVEPPAPKINAESPDHRIPDAWKPGESTGSGALEDRGPDAPDAFSPGSTEPANGGERAAGAAPTPSGSAGSASAESGSTAAGGQSGKVDGNS